MAQADADVDFEEGDSCPAPGAVFAGASQVLGDCFDETITVTENNS